MCPRSAGRLASQQGRLAHSPRSQHDTWANFCGQQPRRHQRVGCHFTPSHGEKSLRRWTLRKASPDSTLQCQPAGKSLSEPRTGAASHLQ